MQQTQPEWRRLATLVQQRRRELGLTQEEVRGRGGPSTATMRLIEGALQDSYRPGIIAALERALRWAPGSVEAILAGGDPTGVAGDAGFVAGAAGSGKTQTLLRLVDGMRPADVPSDDADIQLVMDSDLPDDEKHRLVRDLLRERVEERQRRLERASRYIELYRRAQGT